jgi:hypothetical protein
MLERKGITDIHEAFDRITLTADRARDYIQSREHKEKPEQAISTFRSVCTLTPFAKMQQLDILF